MSMCRVFSYVVGRGCLLWPVHFLGKTLLVFALLHSAFQCRRPGFNPRAGKSPWGRECFQLQYSCLGNPMDIEAWQTTVHGVARVRHNLATKLHVFIWAWTRRKNCGKVTQEKTLHMDITRWSIPKSDWLYSLQPKMEKLYTGNKNKTRSWLWLRSWTPYCQIQT